MIAFRGNVFADPAGLVRFISRRANTCKLRPDQKLVFRRDWETPHERLVGVRALVGELAKIATGKGAAAGKR